MKLSTKIVALLLALTIVLSMSVITVYAFDIPFVPLPDETVEGDLNGDGVADKEDAVRLLMYLYFPDETSYYVDKTVCDFNGDGVVTDADALYLLTLN